MNSSQPPVQTDFPTRASPGVTSQASLAEMRAQGLILGMDAVERAGFPRNHSGSSKLYQLRDKGVIPGHLINGNWYFRIEDLDAYREKNETGERAMTTSVKSPPTVDTSEWDRVRTTTSRHPEPEVGPSPDTLEILDEDEDYGEMEAGAQAAARRAFKRIGVTRWRHMDTDEVEQRDVRAWHIAVTLPNGITVRSVRVVRENGRYIAQSEDVLAFLESENAQLRKELATATQLAKANRGTKKRGELREWRDPELVLFIWIEELGGNGGQERRISSDDFPTVTASGHTLEQATANYRLLLRGLLCAYRQHQDAGRELKFAQEAQLEKLQLLFDEL